MCVSSTHRIHAKFRKNTLQAGSSCRSIDVLGGGVCINTQGYAARARLLDQRHRCCASVILWCEPSWKKCESNGKNSKLHVAMRKLCSNHMSSYLFCPWNLRARQQPMPTMDTIFASPTMPFAGLSRRSSEKQHESRFKEMFILCVLNGTFLNEAYSDRFELRSSPLIVRSHFHTPV